MNNNKLRKSISSYWSTVRSLELFTILPKAGKKIFYGIFAILLVTGIGFGDVFAQQEHQVSGTVTDAATGESLPGVNIMIVGTETGTTTDLDGQYSITLSSPDESLRFSYIGYEEIVIDVQGQDIIDVDLQAAVISGEELVVVGYSVQQRRDITGSIASVDMESFSKQSVAGEMVSSQLQGRVSGVSVTSSGQPGESPDIRIRGINTFGDNSPLFIVDGVPTSNIEDISPSDISSMQVLKDAAAASIYGARAANGVIVIATNRGAGSVQVNYSGTVGVDVPGQSNPWNMLSPIEQAELRFMALANSGTPVSPDSPDAQYGPGPDPRLPDYIQPNGAMEGEVDLDDYFIIPEYNDPGLLSDFNRIVRANHEGTDWFSEIFDTAVTTNHELSVSGGGEIGNYMFSVNYLDQEGTLMNVFRQRVGLRANTSFNIGENIRVGENLSYTVSESPQVASLTEGSAIGMAYRSQTIIPVHDVMGNYAGSFGANLGNSANPVAMMDRTRNNESSNERLFGNVFAEIDLSDNLMFRTSFGGEISTGNSRSFSYPTYEEAENSPNNSFSVSSYEGRNYTWTNTLQFNETYGRHNVELLIGSEIYRNWGSGVSGTTQDYFSFDPNFTNLDTGSGLQTNSNYFYEDALMSGFGRVDYSFDDRYILSATLRRDGSSRFLENRWGWFPAGSVGWRISNESFMDGVTWIDDLRFIAGYGVMGNQVNVNPANAFTLFAGSPASSYYSIDGSNTGTQLGFERDRIGNPAAQWESNINANVGFEGRLFQDRLEIAFEYYWKDVQDLLFAPEQIATIGAATVPSINIANMENRGIDATLTTLGQIGADAQYNVTFTFTSYHNEIVNISDDVTHFSQESRRFDGIDFIRNEVGHSVSSFYGYQIDGFWQDEQEIEEANSGAPSGTYQTDAAVGRFKYADITGDGEVTSADRTFLGDPNPDFTYGINIGLDYRNWDMTMFFYGSQGNDIWNQVKWWTDFFPSFQGGKSHTALYDSWTPDNRDATAPIQENEGSFSTNAAPNSYYVEDGSYLRLRNLQVGYTIPTDFVQRAGLSNLRLYVQANNLFTITGYSGIDPEVGYFTGSGAGGGSTNFGIDEGQYPTFRQFLFGINLSI
jgi:TonB-dependent starch-binding outer membrane protein SusC